MQKFAFLKHSLSAKISVSVLLLLNFIAFHFSVKYPQCCDADSYISEANGISKIGFIPDVGEDSWLSMYHNYLYPSFLHFLNFLGITTRWQIGFTQFTAILLANFFVSYRLKRAIGIPIKFGFSFILAGNLLAVYAYSGFFLTEAIAAVFITMWSGLMLEMLIRRNRSESTKILFVLVSFLAGAAWMTRPALIWVPIATLLISMFDLSIGYGSVLDKLKTILFQVSSWFIIIVCFATPQWLVSMNNRGLASGVFKLGEWEWHQTFEATAYRYLTNVSDCGPIALVFSPFTQTYEGMWPPKYRDTFIFKFNDLIATFVSGWDAVPSPLAYVNELSVFPWIFLTMVSGFLISVPFIACIQSFKDPRYNKYRRINLSLLLLFLLSQAAVAITHGEFRFNFAGWILSSILLLYALSNNMFGFRLSHYIAISLFISTSIVIIGQLTLSLSNAWISCVPG
jgi:hypothetical protein